jgi:hypothetical protein
MKNLRETFSSIFSDDEWFNKVLVGGFYILFVLCGIGIVMINGYIVEFMKSLLAGNRNLPYWREFSKVVKTGWKVSAALVLYYGAATLMLYFAGVPVISVTVAVVYFILHTTLHPLVLLAYAQSPRFGTCFNPVKIFRPIQQAGKQISAALFLSAIFLCVSITLGWMAIIVGWTLLVFLSLLIQNTAVVLAVKNHLASHS